MRRAGTLLFLLLSALGLTAEEFGPVTIERVPPMLEAAPAGGYYAREFRVINPGAKPVEIRFELLGRGSWGRRETEIRAFRSLVAPPGSVQQLEIFAPVGREDFGTEFKLRLHVGRREYENHLLGGSGGGYGGESTLYSGSVPVDDYRRIGLFTYDARPSDIPVAQWGRKFRDYLGLRRVVVGGSDRLPPEVAAAIRQYVFAGGELVVHLRPEDEWPGVEPAEHLHSEPHGWGKIVTLRPVTRSGRAEVDRFLQAHTAELRRHQRVEAKLALGPAAEYLREEERAYGPAPVRDHREPGLISQTMPLPIQQLPLRKLFFVMLLFVILIGPVNYLWLKRRGREPWILVTTPALSFAFCVVVVLFITLNEGWHSRGRAFGVTLLDQEAGHLAATRAWSDVYAPIAPAVGLRFERNDAVFFKNAGRLVIDEDAGQHFLGSVIQPRIPLYSLIERVEFRREQLKIAAAGDRQLAVTNGLGRHLAELAVAAPDGFVCRLAGLAAGERGIAAAARPAAATAKQFDASALYAAAVAVPGRRENALDEVAKHLPPGYYAALLEAPLFYGTGEKSDDFQARHLVIGKYELSGETE